MEAADQLNLSVKPDNLTRQQGSMNIMEPDMEVDQSLGLFMAEEDDDVAMLQASGVVGNDAMLGAGNLEENELFVDSRGIDIRFEQEMHNLMKNSKPEFMMEIDIASLGPPESQEVVPSASANPETDLGDRTNDLEVVVPAAGELTKTMVPRVEEEANQDETVNQVTVEGARCQRQKRRNVAVEQAIVELVPETQKPRKGVRPGISGGRAGKPKSGRGKSQKNEALVPQEVANAFEPKLLQLRPPRKWSAPRPIPEEEKDDTYKIKREINTESARKCRERKRNIDQKRVELIQLQVNRIQELEQEVQQLKTAHEVLRSVIQGGIVMNQQEIQQPLALPAPPQQSKGKKRGKGRNK